MAAPIGQRAMSTAAFGQSLFAALAILVECSLAFGILNDRVIFLPAFADLNLTAEPMCQTEFVAARTQIRERRLVLIELAVHVQFQRFADIGNQFGRGLCRFGSATCGTRLAG